MDQEFVKLLHTKVKVFYVFTKASSRSVFGSSFIHNNHYLLQ